MVIQNPYKQVPHKGFKKTFLEGVSASVSFADTSLLNNKEALNKFLRFNFGITEDFPNVIQLGAVDVSSENKVEKYHFSTNFASIFLDASVYRFYADSLEPRINRLVDFLNAIGVNHINELTISKKNIFRGTSENAYSAWRFALHEAFKDDSLRELAANSSVSNKPFKITIEGVGKFEGGEVRVPFLVEVSDENNFHFQMDVVGVVRNIDVTDIIANANVLNEIIFSTFLSMISDKTINLLQQ